MRRFALFVPAALWPGAALAQRHPAVRSDLQQVSDGVETIFAHPETFLPLIALGLFLSLWKRDGLTRAWPAGLIGQLAALFAAPFLGPSVVLGALAVGAVAAAAAALGRLRGEVAVTVLALLTTFLALSAVMNGFGLFTLTLFQYLGLYLGANLALAVPGWVARLLLAKVPGRWIVLVVRVLAGWLALSIGLFLAYLARSQF